MTAQDQTTEINTVVVGYGRAGKGFHCYLISLAPGLNLYGVVSGREEARKQAAADYACQTFESLDEALTDPAVDLIVLATPNHTHCELALQAIDAGKHVVTDKVMCLSLEECQKMVHAAQTKGVFLTCFQNRRFDGDFLTLRKLVSEGRLGDLTWLEMAWQGKRPMRGWRSRAEFGGGRVFDLGAHLVDQLLLFFQEPVESVYSRMLYGGGDTNAETEALILVNFEGGTTGVLDFSSQAMISKPRFYARGTEATFRKYGLDPQESAMMDGDIDSAVHDPANDGVLATIDSEETIMTTPGRWRNFYENVAQVLLNGAEPVVKHSELLRQIQVLTAAQESGLSGQIVRLT